MMEAVGPGFLVETKFGDIGARLVMRRRVSALIALRVESVHFAM